MTVWMDEWMNEKTTTTRAAAVAAFLKLYSMEFVIICAQYYDHYNQSGYHLNKTYSTLWTKQAICRIADKMDSVICFGA